MGKIYDRQQKNQQTALDFSMEIANNNYSNSIEQQAQNNIQKELPSSGDLTATLEILHDLKDSRSNIFCYRSTPGEDGTRIKVRDARGAIKPPINAPEIFAIQIINHTRAAIMVAKDNLSQEEAATLEKEITELAFKEAKAILESSKDKTNEDFSVEKQEKRGSWSIKLRDDVTNFNTLLCNKLTDLGVTTPQRQLQDAKDYTNFQDEHYHKATIYNVKDGKGIKATQVELDVMALGLTKEQRNMFEAIQACPEIEGQKMQIDQENMAWFNHLEKWQQKQLKNAVPAILTEQKVCPTQLNFLPLPKNFYIKSIYIARDNRNPELTVSTMHGGTPTAMAGSIYGDKLTATIIRNIQEFTAEKKVTIDSLTTPFSHSAVLARISASINPIEVNEPRHITAASKEFEQGQIKRVITPLNIGRILPGGSGRQLEEYNQELAVIRNHLDENKFKLTKDYLKPKGSKVTFKEVEAELTDLKKENLELYKSIRRVAETKRYIKSFNSRLYNSQTGIMDKENIHANIASNMEIIVFQANYKATKFSEIMKGQTLSPIYTHCKSGKDRTGEEQTLTAFNAANDKLNVEIGSDIWKENRESQFAAGHTNDLAGCGQGGTHGCFGIQIPSAKDSPNKVFTGYTNWIGQITAKMNKFEVKTTYKMANLKEVKHVIKNLVKFDKIKKFITSIFAPAKENKLFEAKVRTAKNYKEACELYQTLAKGSFTVASDKLENGVRTIIHDDPSYKKGDKDHQVTYIIKNGKLSSIIVGKATSCIIPPLESFDKGKSNGFTAMKFENGGVKEVYKNGSIDAKIATKIILGADKARIKKANITIER